jgi:serine/threonine-protein kinase
MTQIGHYEVGEKLGEGGMGVVYRARDSKLGREVALKVLPPALAEDPERLARLQREAQVLASLNHPNIAHIYGIEGAALVMEYVPGEALRGPLPVDEAMAIARQIGDALEAAHEKGIIHRDLKPANVKVTPDGQVKVLDFGLAKALSDDPTGSTIANSPTLSMAATRAGVILGTAAYMSPEQARGKPLDRRTDIWAFGCVLYELLTGKQAFGGETVTDSMAAIVKSDPDWSLLPPGSPVELLRLCLQKDPKLRLRDIGDSALITGIGAKPAVTAATTLHFPALIGGIFAGLFVVFVAAMALRFGAFAPPPAPRPVQRLLLSLAPLTQVYGFAISEDGRRLVVAGGMFIPEPALCAAAGPQRVQRPGRNGNRRRALFLSRRGVDRF